ncbi:hypothetical protein [Deinococcus sonorensis]|uniref:Polymerase nucleotidyl transferase domain-containing protein n=1 Tax=Deinococcus sonorensis TaxID=309891 RepID=A0ABV8YCH5_9DEIO
MHPLTTELAPAFLARHVHFYDGLLRRADLVYDGASRRPSPDLDVLVEVKDNESASGWCRLTLHFEGVVSFRVVEGGSTNVVMSPSGVILHFEESSVLADFSPVTDVEYDRADFERSTFAVEARALSVVYGPPLL